MSLKKLLFLFCVLLTAIIFSSCKTIKQPEKIFEPLDYTDNDVIQNEISAIRALKETDSTKALFRACLIEQYGADALIVNECATLVREQAEQAFDQKDYTKALCLYKSLASVNIDYQENLDYYQKCLDILLKDVPGLASDKEKLPSTVEDCINATVTVWVDQGYKVQNGAGYADIVIGSGFFIDRRGYIVTNHHVIAEMVNPKRKTSCKLYIKLPSDMEKKIPARVVGYDSVMDLALLKVEIEPQFVLELGSSSELQVGDSISAIGTPIGLEGTLTSGIISSASRQLLTLGKVFQIDAAVNSGNSGGPLIDSNRKVQAIVFAGMLQYQGLNFAIPVEYLKTELPFLYSGGELNHSWTGSYGHDKKIGGQACGLEIQYVMPGGSASLSGLKIDDVIYKADGMPVNSLEDFQNICMKYMAGTIITCAYEHEGLKNECLVYLEKRPEAPLKEIFDSDFVQDSFIPIFGIKMVRSSTTNRNLYRIEYVLEGSTADQNGFSENDNLELRDVSFYQDSSVFVATVMVQRRKKGFLDIAMQLVSSYDSPNYF